MSTHLILIRHGQPERYESGSSQVMSGWTDLSLSMVGREQIAALAERLTAKGISFEAIYSSPLARAAQSAAAIARKMAAQVVHLGSLKEINCGIVDGWPISAVKSQYRALWQANLRQDDEAFRWPGGESYSEFRNRCLAAAIDIALKHSGKRVAIVTHAGVISQLVGYLHGLSAAQWEPFRPGPSSLTELQWHEHSGKVLRFDEQLHLGESAADVRPTGHPRA